MKKIFLFLTALFFLNSSCDNDDSISGEDITVPEAVDMKIPQWLIGTWGVISPDGTQSPLIQVSENDICEYWHAVPEIRNCVQHEIAILTIEGIVVSPYIGWNDYAYSFNYSRGAAFNTHMQFLRTPGITDEITWFQFYDNEINLKRLN